MTTPEPDLEQRALNKVNQGEGWLKAHWHWIAVWLATAAVGFILGKLL
jgi:hypothetical protein